MENPPRNVRGYSGILLQCRSWTSLWAAQQQFTHAVNVIVVVVVNGELSSFDYHTLRSNGKKQEHISSDDSYWKGRK